MTASLFFLILKIDVGDAILTANTFQNDIQVVNEISKLKIEISFFSSDPDYTTLLSVFYV